MAPQNPPLSQQDEAVLEAAGVISALANEMKLGRHPGTTAAIVQQSSTPVLIMGGMMLIAGLCLTVWNLAMQESDERFELVRQQQAEDLKDRIEVLEAYNQQILKRLTTVETKEK